MAENSNFTVVNIRQYLNSDIPNAGEDELIEVISGFSCPKNLDVERFLKKNSIEFTKKNQSVTYLVFRSDIEIPELVGYFTLALKPLSIKAETVSNTVKRKLQRISEYDDQSQTYTMSAYLIAQLGRNFADEIKNPISGAELLQLAWNVILQMQYMGGGVVTFLEAEEKDKLLSFYIRNRFSKFDTRMTTSKNEESHELIQFLRLL